ncbi:peptidase [Cellulosimicrobium protaetiae]|uniref:Peptidase n=1 Tax=Cellulosimicrobium protaetiae TaxID=2587808 RepID=A0A6M5UDM9_9MICO|nr:peptidase [Cellulosimicrobium protaetiae]QJW35752.1 peptidase [Cellulosimicrobium protaetiae]
MITSGGRRLAARALAVTTTAAAAALLAAPAAVAADGDTYVPEPTIDLTVLTPVCDGDVPYLEYAVDVTGTDNDTATITWINPDGDDIVQSGMPLSGRVLWPGAVVGPDGRGADWPGWSLVDGEWVEGDEFDWVRPSVQVLFQVNPETVVTVDYPPSSPNCATNPPGKTTTPPTVTQVSNPVDAGTQGTSLAETGATVGLYAAVAAGLAAVGAAIVLLTRRTRKS